MSANTAIQEVFRDALAVASFGPEIFWNDLTRPDEPAVELRSDSGDGTWTVDVSPEPFDFGI
jgi:hypothetical protein